MRGAPEEGAAAAHTSAHAHAQATAGAWAILMQANTGKLPLLHRAAVGHRVGSPLELPMQKNRRRWGWRWRGRKHVETLVFGLRAKQRYKRHRPPHNCPPPPTHTPPPPRSCTHTPRRRSPQSHRTLSIVFAPLACCTPVGVSGTATALVNTVHATVTGAGGAAGRGAASPPACSRPRAGRNGSALVGEGAAGGDGGGGGVCTTLRPWATPQGTPKVRSTCRGPSPKENGVALHPDFTSTTSTPPSEPTASCATRDQEAGGAEGRANGGGVSSLPPLPLPVLPPPAPAPGCSRMATRAPGCRCCRVSMAVQVEV
jgi:hypothetical protein